MEEWEALVLDCSRILIKIKEKFFKQHYCSISYKKNTKNYPYFIKL